MFDSTMELLTVAASNSLIVFGLCNLIIGILFLSGPKPSSPSTQESFICAQEVPKRIEKEEKGGDEGFTSEETEASLSATVPQETNAEKSPRDEVVSNVCIEESGYEDECKEDEDELRKRVEEFIEKVNRGFKAEKFDDHRR